MGSKGKLAAVGGLILAVGLGVLWLRPVMAPVREGTSAERWERVRRYDWSASGEFVYLSALVVFAAWPWLRNGRPLRWAVHLGLVPVLLFLPYWLGYAGFTFTSAGPSGGVLYPWLIVWFGRLPWTALDTAIVSRLPPVLEPYSQTPGPMLSL